MKQLLLISMLFAATACNRDNAAETDSPAGMPRTETITLPNDVAWMNTGVLLAPGQRIYIEADGRDADAALGRPEADLVAPIPTAGAFGLIAKMGESGIPVAVGKGLDVQGNSANWGESLFIGRNGKPSDFATPQTSDATEDVTSVSKTALLPLRVILKVEASTAPASMAPVNGFFTSNVSPTFDWDDAENSIKYVFELSRFPDFRDQVLSLEPTSSNVSLANFTSESNNSQTPTLPGQTNPAATLPEGKYFWRVKSQVNIGRTIAPVLKWTDYSAVSWFGVETRASVPPPRVFSPIAGNRYPLGENVLIEFSQSPDASGLFWRYKGYQGACGTVLDASGQAKRVSPWFVFRQDLESNVIGQVPQQYGAAVLKNLEAGEYLVQVEVVDGADGRLFSVSRAGISETAFSVGCQN